MKTDQKNEKYSDMGDEKVKLAPFLWETWKSEKSQNCRRNVANASWNRSLWKSVTIISQRQRRFDNKFHYKKLKRWLMSISWFVLLSVFRPRMHRLDVGSSFVHCVRAPTPKHWIYCSCCSNVFTKLEINLFRTSPQAEMTTSTWKCSVKITQSFNLRLKNRHRSASWWMLTVIEL